MIALRSTHRIQLLRRVIGHESNVVPNAELRTITPVHQVPGPPSTTNPGAAAPVNCATSDCCAGVTLTLLAPRKPADSTTVGAIVSDASVGANIIGAVEKNVGVREDSEGERIREALVRLDGNDGIGICNVADSMTLLDDKVNNGVGAVETFVACMGSLTGFPADSD